MRWTDRLAAGRIRGAAVTGRFGLCQVQLRPVRQNVMSLINRRKRYACFWGLTGGKVVHRRLPNNSANCEFVPVPYVHCDCCTLTTYATAAWSHSAECPHCGAPLDIPRHGARQGRVRVAMESSLRARRRARDRRRRPVAAAPMESWWR